MSKHEIIEAIRQVNRTANPEYLVRFEQRALESYLRRLTTVLNRRGRDSRWVREGDTHAVVTVE